MITAGIDAGSRAIKVVLWDADAHRCLAAGVADQGVRQNELAERLFGGLLAETGLQAGDVTRVVASGYGRNLIRFADATITEITCQAAGVRQRLARAASIIDIGGQDSKIIRLNGDGRVRSFSMNDRCAAGTGRFLEVAATRLGMELNEFGSAAGLSDQPAVISSMCVVFAETEIVGLLAEGAAPRDIAAGIQRAIAGRLLSLAAGTVAAPVVFTGGVALVPGMAQALAAAVGQPVEVVPDPQTTCALGAALLAADYGGTHDDTRH